MLMLRHEASRKSNENVYFERNAAVSSLKVVGEGRQRGGRGGRREGTSMPPQT